MVSLASGLHRRDLTSTSPAKHGLTTTPPLLSTTATATPTSRRLVQPARRSFTIADLLGGGDDLQDDSRAASSSSSPPAGGHDPSLMQEGVGGLFDDPHDPSSALHPQEDFTAVSDPGSRFEWLQCTRYHPPKLPREYHLCVYLWPCTCLCVYVFVYVRVCVCICLCIYLCVSRPPRLTRRYTSLGTYCSHIILHSCVRV